MSEWISVEDRLPEAIDDCISDDVLTYSPGRSFHVAEYNYKRGGWYNVSHDGTSCFPSVTHWMPLPEPPKTGQGGI